MQHILKQAYHSIPVRGLASGLLACSMCTAVSQACIVQVRKNPSVYGIPGGGLSESAVEKVLKDQLILSNVSELAKYGMVRVCSHICVTWIWSSDPWAHCSSCLAGCGLHCMTSVRIHGACHSSGHDKVRVSHIRTIMFPMHKEGGKSF